MYAALPRSGYGSLAVAEAAMAEAKPVARVVKTAGEQRLALAAPATDRGGQVVACGTPEEISKNKASYTGFFLKNVLTGR